MKTTIILLLFLLGYINAFGQKNIAYSKKIEVGYDLFMFRTLIIDPGPNWMGYNLDEDQNGFEVNFINGVTAYDHFFAGTAVFPVDAGGRAGRAGRAERRGADPDRIPGSPLVCRTGCA